MKSKVLLFACILTVSSYSFNAFSEESNFCDGPLKTVCENTRDERAASRARVESLKNEIFREAQKNSAPQISEMEKKYKGPLNTIRRHFKSIKIQNLEIMKSAKSKIGGVETIITDPQNISMFKDDMKQAIEEASLDQSTRNSFKKIIDSIIIGNYADFLEQSGMDSGSIFKMNKSPCGISGMADNAFATRINNQKYVLVCPGSLITISQISNDSEKLKYILQTIYHEMAHFLDNAKLRNNTYKPFLRCISENYSLGFNATPKDEKFCKKKAKGKDECNMQVTDSHAGELIADQWAIQVLGVHAKKNAYTIAQKESLLINSFASLCMTADEGIHPSGDFRIETLLRVNPEISNYLSCNNSKIIKPSCTFDGAVNL